MRCCRRRRSPGAVAYVILILQDRDRKLRIFSGNEHPFHDRPLEPFVMPPRQVRQMRPRARRALIRARKKEQANKGAGWIHGLELVLASLAPTIPKIFKQGGLDWVRN
jgi:hypothetical protein